MAVDTSNGHPAMDYREHLQTYDGFVRGAVILTVLIVLLLLGMLFFLV
ncbi:MAG: aa3-type cytochrome c oxidase subunit IV [Hyphomicrobiaceae bacterium]